MNSSSAMDSATGMSRISSKSEVYTLKGEELIAELDRRGILHPPNATVIQLRALLSKSLSLAWLVIPLTWNFALLGITFNSWRLFVVLCALPSILTCFLIHNLLPESPKFLINQGKIDEALQVLRAMYVNNTGNSASKYKVQSILEETDKSVQGLPNSSFLNIIKNIWHQILPLFQKPHLNMTLLLCFLQFGCYTCFNSILLWLPEVFNNMASYSLSHDGKTTTICESMSGFVIVQTALNSTTNNSSSNIPTNISLWAGNTNTTDDVFVPESYLNSSWPSGDNVTQPIPCITTVNPATFQNTLIIGGGMGVINLAIGYIVKWTGRKIISFMFLVSAAVSCVVLYFATSWYLVLLLAFFFVCFIAVSSSLLNSSVVDIFPTSLRAMAVCLTLMAGRTGVVGGSLMIGALIDTHCSLAFVVLSGVALPQNGKKGNEKTSIEEIIPLTVQKRKTVRISFSEEETPLGSPRDLGSRPVLFEEAIARTGHGKFHYLLLFTCGLGLISMIVETVCVSYLMPAAECDFQMTSHDKGILSAICYFGMVASSHLWGYLADTRGRRKVLIATLLLDFLCAIVGSFAHTFWLFVVFRFLNGFFICGPSAVVYVYLGEFHTAEHRTKAIMWACIFISIGIISLPGLAWLVIPLKWNFDTPWFPYSSWRLFVALCGVPSLVTCIIMALFLPESPKFYQAIGQDEEALKALRYIYTVNKGNSPDKYPVKAIMSDPSQEDVEGEVGTSRSSGVFTSIWKQTAPLFQTPHLRNTVIACLIQLGLYASFNSLLLWLPDLFNRLAVYSSSHPNQTATVCEILSILKKEGDDSLLSPENLTSHATVLTNKSSQLNSNVTSSCVVNIDPIVFQNTLVIGFTSAMAYLLVSQVVNHVNKNKIVAFALAASGLTILGMYFVHTTAEVLPLSCIYVALPGMCVSVLSGIVIDIFPTHLRAMAVCLSLMMGRLGTGASSLMLGALLEFNCALVIFILVGVVIGCGMLALLLPSPEKKVTSL